MGGYTEPGTKWVLDSLAGQRTSGGQTTLPTSTSTAAPTKTWRADQKDANLSFAPLEVPAELNVDNIPVNGAPIVKAYPHAAKQATCQYVGNIGYGESKVEQRSGGPVVPEADCVFPPALFREAYTQLTNS